MNKVLLKGTVTKDPTTYVTNSGDGTQKKKSVFRIAIPENYSDADGNRAFTYATIETWRKADFVEQHLRKGVSVLIDGSLRNDDYTDKDGIKRYEMIVLVDACGSIEFAERKNTSAGTTESQPQGVQPVPQQSRPQGTQPVPQRPQPQGTQPGRADSSGFIHASSSSADLLPFRR